MGQFFLLSAAVPRVRLPNEGRCTLSSHENIATTFNDWVAGGKADGLEDCHGNVALQVSPRAGSTFPGTLPEESETR